MNFDIEMLASIGIYLIIGAGVTVFSAWLNFKYNAIIFQLKKDIKQKNDLLKKLEFDLNIPKVLETNEKIDIYLLKRLEQLFSSFIFKDILHTLKKYSTTLSEESKVKYREDFLKFLEFNLTEVEKDIFKSRYTSFELFKFICIDYFNIKLTKLELFICHKVEMKDEEFIDQKLFSSLYDSLSTKDIKSINQIIETINQGESK